ncbi:hypothetical protein CGW93_01645 [candidate division bacterium WOR-3 4484_18]|uniref:Uncharacterized protein n=1 Tax=candidate division WOR-3 bacterium 4484_18 TaxID=2020626 RepID=A0A257LUC3_UNCW3|nr:MAG: hypothetical protein CGW93_01645 [candidate division bacterium WOR-3 4484_18]
MRRRGPLTLAFIAGVAMIIQFFSPHPILRTVYTEALNWYRIISAFTFMLGLISLMRSHITKVTHKRAGWGYSIVTIVSFIVMTILGFTYGTGAGTPFDKMYEYVYAPLGATVFSLLAFYLASASFRAFRARNIDATILLVVAIIIMLGRVPVGSFIRWGRFSLPGLAEWIMAYPNMAAQRGLLIGIALGAICMSLKIILGIERSYLGRGG